MTDPTNGCVRRVRNDAITAATCRQCAPPGRVRTQIADPTREASDVEFCSREPLWPIARSRRAMDLRIVVRHTRSVFNRGTLPLIYIVRDALDEVVGEWFVQPAWVGILVMVVFGAAGAGDVVGEAFTGEREGAVPVQWCGAGGAGGVGGGPRGVEGGEFFDEGPVPVPTRWNGARCQCVAVGEELDPFGEPHPFPAGGGAVQVAPAHGFRRPPGQGGVGLLAEIIGWLTSAWAGHRFTLPVAGVSLPTRLTCDC
jgi:hypothetical protein